MLISLIVEMIALGFTSLLYLGLVSSTVSETENLMNKNNSDVVYSFLYSSFEDKNQCLALDWTILTPSSVNLYTNSSDLFDKKEWNLYKANSLFFKDDSNWKELNQCNIFYLIEGEKKFIYIKQWNSFIFQKEEIQR